MSKNFTALRKSAFQRPPLRKYKIRWAWNRRFWKTGQVYRRSWRHSIVAENSKLNPKATWNRRLTVSVVKKPVRFKLLRSIAFHRPDKGGLWKALAAISAPLAMLLVSRNDGKLITAMALR